MKYGAIERICNAKGCTQTADSTQTGTAEVGEERESLIAEVAQMIEAKAADNAERMATIESTCKTIKTEASDAMHDLRVDLREVQ